MTDSFDEIESWSNQAEATAAEPEEKNEKGSKVLLIVGIAVAAIVSAALIGVGYFLGADDSASTVSSTDQESTTTSAESTPSKSISLESMTATAVESIAVDGQPHFVASIKDHTIEVAGRVSSEQEKATLEAIVGGAFGAVTGGDSIEIDPELEPLSWLEGSLLLMGTFISENSLEGTLAANNTDAIMDMSVPRQENSQIMESALTQLGLNVENNAVVFSELLGPEINFSFAGEALEITGELPTEALIDEVLADLEPNFPQINANITVNPERYAGYGYTFMDRNLAIVKPLNGFDISISEADFNITLADAIAFEPGSAELQPQVEEFTSLFVQSPLFIQSSIVITGHTDNVGSEDANQVLSEERAQAVAASLVANGYRAEQLTVEGKGETEPVGDNNTDEGQAANRRVELSILN